MLFFTKMRYNTEVKHDKLWGKNVVATSQRAITLSLTGFSRRVLLPAGVIKKIHGGRQNYETTAF